MKLSIVIPAYNEEKLLPRCLESVFTAIRKQASPEWSAEVIVTDNNSTDRTAELARAAGARVVFEPVNQISRARNAGARMATGDWLLFVDADSILDAAVLGDLLRRIRRGDCAGGGCRIDLDHRNLSVNLVVTLSNFILRTMHWAAGSFLFCRRDAFEAVGGFSTKVYAAEEIVLSRAIKRWGAKRGLDFIILTRRPHISSARKFHFHGLGGILWAGARIASRGRGALEQGKHLSVFYDGRR